MKNLKKSCILLIAIILLSSINSIAQHGRHGGRGNNRVVVVKNNRHGNRVVVKSRFRPAKVIVYHPYWGLKRNFNRRWVYFPRYNFYWDNWRNAYVYRNGRVWITNTAPPPTIVNVNISNEKHYELKEDDDDVDDVYNTNEVHKTEYKPE